MNCIASFVIFLILAVGVYILLAPRESFYLDSYLRPNYESGANMLRGDLPIVPVHQSWFNTDLGPQDLVPGYF